MQGTSIITRVEGPVETTVGCEIVLMTLASGECIGLGETGSDVWRLLQDPVSIDQLVLQVREMYQAPDGVIEQDILELLERLSDLHLIRIVG